MLAVGVIAIAVCAAVFVAIARVRDDLDREVRRGSDMARSQHGPDENGEHALRQEMK